MTVHGLEHLLEQTPYRPYRVVDGYGGFLPLATPSHCIQLLDTSKRLRGSSATRRGCIRSGRCRGYMRKQSTVRRRWREAGPSERRHDWAHEDARPLACASTRLPPVFGVGANPRAAGSILGDGRCMGCPQRPALGHFPGLSRRLLRARTGHVDVAPRAVFAVESSTVGPHRCLRSLRMRRRDAAAYTHGPRVERPSRPNPAAPCEANKHRKCPP